MVGVLSEIDKQIAALEANLSEEGSSDSASSSDDGDSSCSASISDVFSGYSCDSSSSDESSETESPERTDPTPQELVEAGFVKKANQIARKKARFGMSTICFKHLAGACSLEDCVFKHARLESLSEEERGELTRELRRRPFDQVLGNLIKQLNIPSCKTFSKTGECKFAKCRFWHIETENDAKWAGSHFWCQPCRKAFTSESQLREHCSGKLHKSRCA